MGKVIKAVSAKLIGEDEKEIENEAEENGEEISEDKHEEFQAAYDELISAAQDEVALMLEDARNEAQIIVDDAKKSAAQIRKDAYSKGISDSREEADAIIAGAQEERLNVIDAAKTEIFNLALDIAEKILKYELDNNNNAYMNILTGALNTVKTKGDVTLHVNAAEYTRFFDGHDKTQLCVDDGAINANVIVDPSVEQGGCFIETEIGVIDASVSSQLEQIAARLTE